MATRFGDAVTALLAAYEAANLGIPVYDGIIPQTASDPACVIVGHDGTLEADGTLAPDVVAGNFTQQWIEMGARQETGYVSCVVICQSGDAAGLPALRVQGAGLLEQLEAAADANGGYAGGLTGMTFDATANGRWIYRQSLAGAAVMISYRVSYSTEW